MIDRLTDGSGVEDVPSADVIVECTGAPTLVLDVLTHNQPAAGLLSSWADALVPTATTSRSSWTWPSARRRMPRLSPRRGPATTPLARR